MQYDVDSGGGTGFRLKYILCRHRTMTIFPFICYLQDVYWACARLVVWRHTRACTLKQQCAWSDEHLQTVLRHEGFPATCSISVGILFFTCVWLTDIFVMLHSALFLFPNLIYFCLYHCTVNSVVQQTHTYICYFIKLKFTLKRSNMFRANDHPQRAYIFPC